MSFDSIARANKINLYKNIIHEETKNKQKLEEQRLIRVREASARAMNELHKKLDEEVHRHNDVYGQNISLINNPARVEGGFVDAANLAEYKKIVKKREIKNKTEEMNHAQEAAPFQQPFQQGTPRSVQAAQASESTAVVDKLDSIFNKITTSIESENINNLLISDVSTIYDTIVKDGYKLEKQDLEGYVSVCDILINSVDTLIQGWSKTNKKSVSTALTLLGFLDKTNNILEKLVQYGNYPVETRKTVLSSVVAEEKKMREGNATLDKIKAIKADEAQTLAKEETAAKKKRERQIKNEQLRLNKAIAEHPTRGATEYYEGEPGLGDRLDQAVQMIDIARKRTNVKNAAKVDERKQFVQDYREKEALTAAAEKARRREMKDIADSFRRNKLIKSTDIRNQNVFNSLAKNVAHKRMLKQAEQAKQDYEERVQNMQMNNKPCMKHTKKNYEIEQEHKHKHKHKHKSQN